MSKMAKDAAKVAVVGVIREVRNETAGRYDNLTIVQPQPVIHSRARRLQSFMRETHRCDGRMRWRCVLVSFERWKICVFTECVLPLYWRTAATRN